MYSALSRSSSMVAAMPRFSRIWLLNFAQRAQQIIVLHVAGAHLQHVHVARHQVCTCEGIHDFADDEQAVLVGGRAHHFQAVFAEALERVG